MKKMAASILTVLGIFSATAWADDSQNLYFGLDIFGTSNQFDYEYAGTTKSEDFDSAGFKLIFGALLVYDMRLQGYLQSEKFNEPLFDDSHDRLTEVGLDLIKAFPVSDTFSPFIQGGIGYGMMDLTAAQYFDSSVEEFNLRIGVGVMYKASDAIELLTGLDLQWRRWSDLDYYDTFPNTRTLQTKDTSERFYVGINYLF